MGITRVSRNDTGAGHTIQLDAGRDGSIVVVSDEGNNFLTRIDEGGTETVIAATTSFAGFRYGYVETLSDGRYALYATWHVGLGAGARVQILNFDGTPATDVVNPMFENGEDKSGSGYTLTATDSGGFAFVWNDTSRASEQFTLTYPQDPNNNSTSTTVTAEYDVRVRYFDATAAPTTASVVADDDVENLNGATVNRRARNQFINDSETLAGGETAFVYFDNRWVGASGGGVQLEQQVSLQISSPGNVGEPVKIDLHPFGNQFGEYPEAIDPGAGANIVPLPDGSFAVIWTEKTYVAAQTWGNYAFSGWQTVIRYFDASGQALTDPIAIVTRDASHNNHSKYVWAEALPDGRIAVAYNVGVSGVNGNGTLDAFVGIVGPLGSSIDVTQVNVAAQNTQFYTIEDFAVRSDGTLELAYHDASQSNRTLIERFAVTGPGESARAGTGVGETVSGDGAANVMFGLGGNDQLFGSVGNDRLHGQEGNDVLVGGAGADRLFGGVGNDTYRIDDALDSIVEHAGQGTDTVAASLSHVLAAGASIENLTTASVSGTAAIDLTGNELNNSIYGNAGANRLNGGGGNDSLNGLGGNDTLNGGAGTDNLKGGAGNDIYLINDAADRIYEAVGQGEDRLVATVSYVLTAGASVEVAATSNPAGSTAINLTGNELNNSMFGNEGVNVLIGAAGNDNLNGLGGNDMLNGGFGNDNLRGGTGNDTYIVNEAADAIYESAGQGEDRVNASVSYVLTPGASVEMLGTSNAVATAAINLTGNELNNTIYGNAGANVLSGAAGNDSLNGLSGDDVLKGGAGRDVLRGNTGLDIFQFDTALNAATNVDRIIDFSVADDGIRLENAVFTGLAAGALPAGAFHTGAAAADAGDRIIYNSATGALLFDADGTGGTAAIQFATLATGLALTAGDFTVI